MGHRRGEGKVTSEAEMEVMQLSGQGCQQPAGAESPQRGCDPSDTLISAH